MPAKPIPAPPSRPHPRPRLAPSPSGLGLPLGLLTAALLTSILTPPPCHASILISEVQSANATTRLDEDGDASDWIELTNRGTTPVNLNGWGLSDRTDSPFKWTLPDVTLDPGEFLLLWASSKDRRVPTKKPLYSHPSEIPGLVLWLDATAETFNDGARVATWSDRSGHENHAKAPTLGARPTFIANALNGKPAVRFNRTSSQWLQLPTATFSGMVNLNDFTLLTAAKWSGGTVSGIFGAWGGSSNTGNSHFEIPTNQELRLRVAGMNDLRKTNTLTSGSWTVFGASMQSAGDAPIARLYKESNEIASKSQAAGTTALANYATLAIANSDSSGRFFNGDIGGVLAYNRALPKPEVDFLTTWLAQHHGLAPPPPTDPELHTNFSIDSNGESLVLTQPNGATADLIPAAEIPTDCSYGRPDNATTFAFFAFPTPKASNTQTPFGPPIPPPTISHPRGIQSTAFDVTLSHPDPTATIRYTTDGSDPSPTNGSTYSIPLTISRTTILRTSAFKENTLPVRRITSHSFLFPQDIIQQTAAPDNYPNQWNGFAYTSYSISPTVAESPGYPEAMKSALFALPTLSLALGPQEMFGTAGVYANPIIDGLETPVSAEWIGIPGSPDTQADATLRVQGGASRLFTNSPKKSLRLLFRAATGTDRLRVPVLAHSGTAMADFNTLILRADYNNSWIHWDATQRPRGTLVRDQWMRDTQTAMSGLASHGNHVHLFVNGIYWGIYNPSERPDAAFAASYLGGAREDYDAMTHDGIRDGDNVAWNAMRTITQAGLSSQAQYEAIQQYLDIDHFIDYMIVNLYGGNLDWPHNNWNATRLRQAGAGWLFHCWDAERSLEDLNTNQTGVTGTNNPAEFYAALRNNPEFRLRFADRAHRHCFNNGALTPENASSRFTTLAARLEPAIFAEEARWGAYRAEIYDRNGPSPRYALTPHWLNERSRLLNSYFPNRTAIFISQLTSANLYPTTPPPTFSTHGGRIPPNSTITISHPAGEMFLTTDGTDPRNPATNQPSAQANPTTEVVLSTNTTLKARTLLNGVWSALNEATFILTEPEHRFLPATDADWTLHTNWDSGTYPDGPGQIAVIGPPATGNRNVELRQPVTIGTIRFDNGPSTFRNRLRDTATGNTLTLNATTIPRIEVAGSSTGFTEIDLVSGVHLTQPTELRVLNPTGDPDYGALRLRSTWTGPGGLTKTGPGQASLTGEGKSFTGPIEINEGVLSLTETATPTQASSVAIHPGGQLRLISGSTGGPPRIHAFHAPLQIAGPGLTESPTGTPAGRSGALRYDPGGTGPDHAVLNSPLVLTAPATVHVEGTSSRLTLAIPPTGSHILTKSGGGTLELAQQPSPNPIPVEVLNGTLVIDNLPEAPISLAAAATLTGSGRCGPLSGAGTVLLKDTTLEASSASGIRLAVFLNEPGNTPTSNGLLILPEMPDLTELWIYLPHPGPQFQGALFLETKSNPSVWLHTMPCTVLVPDPLGSHTAHNTTWSPATNAQVVTVNQTRPTSDGPIQGRTLEVRIGAPPASFTAWQQRAFPNTADLENPAISGPLADPSHSGIPNLMRHALGLGPHDPYAQSMPRITRDARTVLFSFPFDPGRNDIACTVEASANPDDWSNPGIVFNSQTMWPPAQTNGWLDLSIPVDSSHRFFRLRIEPLPIAEPNSPTNP